MGGADLGGQERGSEVERADGQGIGARGLKEGDGAGALGALAQEDGVGGAGAEDGVGAPSGIGGHGQQVAGEDKRAGERCRQRGAEVAHAPPLEVERQGQEEAKRQQGAGNDLALSVEGEGQDGAVGFGHGGS